MERRQTHQIGDLDTILDTSHIESAHYIRKSGPYYSERTFYLVVNNNTADNTTLPASERLHLDYKEKTQTSHVIAVVMHYDKFQRQQNLHAKVWVVAVTTRPYVLVLPDFGCTD